MKRETGFCNALADVTENAPLDERCTAQAAVRHLLEWIGEDPDREGLRDTPARVVRAFREYFSGYRDDPREHLSRVFSETGSYRGMVALSHIPFISHCEHHMAPITGKAHVAYVPGKTVVGISKLARVVETFARRLQIQERMTAQISDVIEDVLRPAGVAVVLEGKHNCLCARGIGKQGAVLTTANFTGVFEQNDLWRRQFDRYVEAANDPSLRT